MQESLCRPVTIVDPNQIQTAGWRDRAAAGAVTRFEGIGDAACSPLPLTHELETSHHRANLVVKKGPRRRFDADLVTRA